MAFFLSFIQPGLSLQQDILSILHFLQLCSRCAQSGSKQTRKRGRTGTAPSHPMKKKHQRPVHIPVFFFFPFLFMLAQVSSLPLCCIPKVTAGFCYCGSSLKATGRMGRLSLEVSDPRPSVPVNSDQTSMACFFDEFCLI